MKNNFMKVAATLLLGCGLAAAQDQPATATQPDGNTQTATTRQQAAPRNDNSNWGWIGLLGLLGLAGLRGRRDTRVVAEDDRTSGVRRVA
jgi:MYXO-CTERM domain-containing protein